MAQADTDDQKLLTLTQVSERTGISMPTLQRYKKLYQDRIPSVGKGRTQRYPEAALSVFRELKTENIGRRGRPRKSASGAAKAPRRAAARRKPGRPPRAKAAASSGDLLTLTQVSKETGISYPTLVRYAKMYPDQIPHEGSGRGRRYHKAAVAVFKKLREGSRRGRKAAAGRPKGKARRKAPPPRRGRRPGRPGRPAADVTARVKALEELQKKLIKDVARLEKQLKKPLKLVAQR